MYNVSIPMALVDYIPVVFFGWAAVLLQRDLYHRMPKYAFGHGVSLRPGRYLRRRQLG